MGDEGYNYLSYNDSTGTGKFNTDLEGSGILVSKDGYELISLYRNPIFLSESDAFSVGRELYENYANLAGIQDYEEIIFERIFREKAMDFLTNGKPKLFRSATEGNILVQLTNVSFTPNKQLGRRIYSFTATATEIADCSFENYYKYNILDKNKDINNSLSMLIFANGYENNILQVSSISHNVEKEGEAGQFILYQTHEGKS
jgi:hypothetical protein